MSDSEKCWVKAVCEAGNVDQQWVPAECAGATAASGETSARPVGETSLTATKVEITEKVTFVNDVRGASTSDGYPICTPGGKAGAALYGAFVELRNPSLHSVTFPPPETIVVANAQERAPKSHNTALAGDTRAARCTTAVDDIVDPTAAVLRIVWKRGSHLLNPHAAEHLDYPLKETPSRAETPTSGVVLPKPPCYGVEQQLRRFPDGVHNVETSDRLNEVLLGLSPKTLVGVTSVGKEESCSKASEHVPDRSAISDGSCKGSTSAARDNSRSGSKNRGTLVGETSPEGLKGQVVAPLSEDEPAGDVPGQLTLITACSFNHLTLYAVRHHAGGILDVVPLQTVVASMAPRKITCHCTFLLSVDTCESYVSPGMRTSGDVPVLHGAEKKERKKNGAKQKLEYAGKVFKEEDSGSVSYEGGEALLFEPIRVGGGETSSDAEVMRVATVYLAVEPYLLLGNQSGDILLFSVFKGRVVQRLNSSGIPKPESPYRGSQDDVTTVKQLVCAAVSCITEVSCGTEKRLTCLINNAVESRKQGKDRFTAPPVGAAGTPPSVFAVGFDDGQVLLVDVTAEGACLTKRVGVLSGNPVHAISMRATHYFTRIWTCPLRMRGSNRQLLPTNPVFSSAEVLTFKEDGAIAAVSSNGTLHLLRAPEMDTEVCRVTALQCDTAGDFLSLQWMASCEEAVLLPDLLIATSEDDSIGVYQFVSAVKCTSGWAQRHTSSHEGHNFSTSTETAQDDLLLVARRLFHHSWVINLTTMFHPKGNLLVATSYDGRNSFWTISYGSDGAGNTVHSPNHAPGSDTFFEKRFPGYPLGDINGGLPDLGLVFPLKPSASFVLHEGGVCRCVAGGAGDSHFMVSLCLQGFVRFWEVKWR